MRPNEAKLLQTVFDFLATVIDDYGLYLFMGFVYAVVPFCAWILFGGSRRKSSAEQSPPPRIIVIHQPAERTPSEETFDPFPPPREPDWSDDDRPCD